MERRGQVTRVLTNYGQLETGGTEWLERKVKPSRSDTSRVTGDSQARFCEGLGVKFPGPTRPGTCSASPRLGPYTAALSREMLDAWSNRHLCCVGCGIGLSHLRHAQYATKVYSSRGSRHCYGENLVSLHGWSPIDNPRRPAPPRPPNGGASARNVPRHRTGIRRVQRGARRAEANRAMCRLRRTGRPCLTHRP